MRLMPFGLLFMLATLFVEPTVAGEEVTVLKVLEKTASADTTKHVAELFAHASSVEFRFIPFERVELRGYTPGDNWFRYGYVYHCEPACEAEARKIATRLSSALRADGACPMITGAIVFRDTHDKETDRILVGGDGSCIVMRKQSYLMPKDKSFTDLIAAHKKVFE